MPATIIPGSRCVQSEPGSARASAAVRRRSGRSPAPISSRRGTCAVSRPAMPAVTKIATGQRQEADAGRDGREAEHVLHVDDQVGEQREQRRPRSPRPRAGRRRTSARAAAPRSSIGSRLDALDDDEGGEQQRRSPTSEPIDRSRAPAVRVGSRISPYTSAARPALKVDEAGPVGPRARAGCATPRPASSVIASATTPIGMLTKKIQRHDRPVVIAPPSTGPTATATPVIAPKTPNAMPRSRPWNACASSASEVANMIAPPMPWAPARDREERRAGREPARKRAGREDHDPDREQQPPPVQVGERAGGEQERGERQRVGVDHPLQIGQRRAERLLDVGQRDVHDRDVEQQHEHARCTTAPSVHHLPAAAARPAAKREPAVSMLSMSSPLFVPCRRDDERSGAEGTAARRPLRGAAAGSGARGRCARLSARSYSVCASSARPRRAENRLAGLEALAAARPGKRKNR